MKKYYLIIFILLILIFGEGYYIFYLKTNYTKTPQTDISVETENVIENENPANTVILNAENINQSIENEPIPPANTVDDENTSIVTYTNSVAEVDPDITDIKDVVYPYNYDPERVLISVKDVGKSSLTLVINDSNMKKPVFSQNYTLLYNVNGIWAIYPVPDDAEPFDTTPLIGENNILEQEIKLDKIYGRIPSGTYKIEKTETINGNTYKFTSPTFQLN